MTEDASTSAIGTHRPAIQDPAKRCPKCKYSLCGLPCNGRCPECGQSFEVLEPNPSLAVQRFRESFPRVVRSLLLRKSKQPRRVWFSLVWTLLLIVIVSALFIWGQLLVIRIAMSAFDDRKSLMGCTMVAEYWPMYRQSPVRVRWEGALIVGGLAAGGQVILVLCLAGWYTIASRRVGRGRDLIRRLGAHASAFVPMVTGFAMLPVIVWQIVNVRMMGAGSFISIRPPWRHIAGERITVDMTSIVGIAALTFCAVVASIVLYRSNRNAIREVTSALGQVRVVR